MAESIKMLEMAKRDGISRIFATPHILDGLFANTKVGIVTSVEKLKKHLPEGMELFYGADVRVTPDLMTRIESGEVPTLNASGYLLVELPEYVVPPHLDTLIFNLVHKGITPLITHPERHLRLMRDHAGLTSLTERGAMCQITAMSVTGDFGREVMKASLAMIEKGLVHVVASDAHSTDERPPILSRAHKVVKKHFGDEIAHDLFFENPGRIVEKVIRFA
jgi:protein-tyrosine phosphatase